MLTRAGRPRAGGRALAHGWPGLWSTWANQITALAPDYRLVMPDLRGFGQSTPAPNASFHAMAADLVCMLADAHRAFRAGVGDDWGSQVCAEALRGHPDVFDAASGTIACRRALMDVQYLPAAGPFVPIEHLAKQLDHLTYQVRAPRSTHSLLTCTGVL